MKSRIYAIARTVQKTGACKPWRVYYVASRAVDEAWGDGIEIMCEGKDSAFTYEDALYERIYVEDRERAADERWRERQEVV